MKSEQEIRAYGAQVRRLIHQGCNCPTCNTLRAMVGTLAWVAGDVAELMPHSEELIAYFIKTGEMR